MAWITDKKLNEFTSDFFKDIDMSCLTFLNDLNKDELHNVYNYLYETFYDYNLVYDEAIEKRRIELRIWQEADRLNHLYETTKYEYNPIWNVEGTETTERILESTDNATQTVDITNTKTHDLTDKEQTEYNTTNKNTNKRTDDLTENITETGTDNITHTGTDNTSITNDSTGMTYDYPMNGSEKSRQKQTSTENGSNNKTKNLSDNETKNLSTEQKKTGTQTVEDDGAETNKGISTNTTTGTITDANGGTIKDEKNGNIKETIKQTRGGNIGVTMTQQMIEAERRIILVMYTQLVLTIEDFFFLDM